MTLLMMTLPNALSLLRLVLLLPLWALALSGSGALLAALLLVAAATDVADGIIARKQGATRLGSQLDSTADMLLMGSTLVWLFMLRPDFVREYSLLLLAWAGVGIISLVIGWVRLRRVGNLHLYSAKAVSLLVYPFVAGLLAGFDYPPVLAAVAIGICIIASLEAALIMATRDHVNEHVGSLLKPERRPRRIRMRSTRTT